MNTNSQKHHCNACMITTNHIVVHAHKDEWEVSTDEKGEYPPFVGWDEYSIIKCSGCDSFRFVRVSWDISDENEYTTYFPSSLSRASPKWLTGKTGFRFVMTQTFVPTMLKQIYQAYHAGSHALAAMGIRALIEQVMIDIVGDQGTFRANLNSFQDQGYISLKQRDFLDRTIELGHAAIHRGHEPSSEDIGRSLDIVEPVLETVYVHEGHAEELGKSVPARKKQS